MRRQSRGLEMGRKRKELTMTLTFKFVPVPPSHRAAYDHAWDLLADMLLDDLEAKALADWQAKKDAQAAQETGGADE